MTPTYDNMSREERRTLHGVVISVIAGSSWLRSCTPALP